MALSTQNTRTIRMVRTRHVAMPIIAVKAFRATTHVLGMSCIAIKVIWTYRPRESVMAMVSVHAENEPVQHESLTPSPTDGLDVAIELLRDEIQLILIERIAVRDRRGGGGSNS